MGLQNLNIEKHIVKKSKEETVTMNCRVPASVAEKFEKVAESKSTSTAGLLKAFIMGCVEN